MKRLQGPPHSRDVGPDLNMGRFEGCAHGRVRAEATAANSALSTERGPKLPLWLGPFSVVLIPSAEPERGPEVPPVPDLSGW